MNKEILKTIADNQALLEALKKLLTDKFEIAIPQSDMGVEDIVLGQILRARLVGLRKIEEVFKEIEGLKTPPKEPIKVNMAR